MEKAGGEGAEGGRGGTRNPLEGPIYVGEGGGR